ncbi:DUF3153 domain-containing protein [Euhalothece natronophila Z-M001]|uniref:DUF3153 domain-containing protein n=1 Tax=Euhalothece natronophila Z-M001 TaxID=522448 RepID=A0A5B8NN82_9CHRO|nr:DUF3153 domain-containing protein [Euhalothece natronophila]QDZ40494.1 DUF3153 domain-containing protein [Euhalothece natronophila Z-M001]
MKPLLGQTLKRLFLLLIPLLLTGCVNYEVGVNITGLHRGEIVQHIQLGKQLTSFSQADVEDWLGSLEQRARKLGGKTQRLSPAEVELTIPFANMEQLEAKFNRFFNPKVGKQPPSDLVKFKSQLKINQNNFLFLQRTHLQFNLDLSALGTIKGQNSRLIGANSLLDLEFQLQTPLGLKVLDSDVAERIIQKSDRSAVWYLQPGEENEIEVVFWAIEPLGWGAIAIIIMVYIGLWLKYRYSSHLEDTITQN